MLYCNRVWALGTNGVAPIGDGEQHDQEVLSSSAILTQLQIQVGFCGVTQFCVGQVLFVELRQVPQRQRQLMARVVQALVEIGPVRDVTNSWRRKAARD